MTGNRHRTVTPEDRAKAAAMPLFAGLPAEEVKALLAEATALELEPGAALFSEGDAAEGFFLLLDGMVKIYRSSPKGNQDVLQVFQTGEAVGLVALFGRQVYPAGGEAIQACRLLAIKRAHLMAQLEQSPGLAEKVGEAVARRRSMLVGEVTRIIQKTPLQRLAGLLLDYCHDQRKGPIDIQLPFDRRVLAARIGIAPENLSRDLAKLGHYGVKVKGRRIAVGDVAHLHRLYQSKA